jgi:hypothetical protein
MEVSYFRNGLFIRELNVAYLYVKDRVILYYLPDELKHVVEPVANISKLEFEGAIMPEPGYYVPGEE